MLKLNAYECAPLCVRMQEPWSMECTNGKCAESKRLWSAHCSMGSLCYTHNFKAQRFMWKREAESLYVLEMV